MATGGAVLFAGALVLVAALTLGLIALFSQFMDRDVAMWLAPLLVGGILAAVGYGLVKKALQALKQEDVGVAPREGLGIAEEGVEVAVAQVVR